MGQSGSRQESSRQEPSSSGRPLRPRSSLFLPLPFLSQRTEESAEVTASPAPSPTRRRSTFFGSLGSRSGSASWRQPDSPQRAGLRRRSILPRSTTPSGATFSNPFSRNELSPTRSRRRSPNPSPSPIVENDTPTPASDFAPRLDTPSFDHSLDIPPLRRARALDSSDEESSAPTIQPEDREAPTPASRWRTRSPFRHHTDGSPLVSWRRRSPLRRNEDTSAMLTRLLQRAAAATAVSLTGNTGNPNISSLASGDRDIEGDDGSFNGFLQSLSDGRLAAELENEGARSGTGEGPPGHHAPFQFFRMFRFGHPQPGHNAGSTTSEPSSTTNGDTSQTRAAGEVTEHRDSDRMVPVLIVGIRALNERDSTERTDNMPTFIEAFNSVPDVTTLPSGAATGPGTSEQRRSRRSTISGFELSSSERETLRNTDEIRPTTSQEPASDSPPGPHPPPTTPASPGLSAFSSGTNTPTRRSSISSMADLVNSQSRRGSIYRRLTGTALEPTLEEQQGSQDFDSTRPRGLRRRPRIHSWADGARHDTRRNGVLMEPSNETPSENSSHRSWIIWMIGGNWPENHPILSTPSLFTDNPNYEDMLLLSNILGPVKPPVANAQDVASAGGLLKINIKDGDMAAVDVASAEWVTMLGHEECLVCLSAYEQDEEVRRLEQCKHVFHRECIDQWLTTGRNSCPLCRTQGVEEKTKANANDGAAGVDIASDVATDGHSEAATTTTASGAV